MNLLKSSIDSAYSAQIANLFRVLASSLIDSNENEALAAQDRFKKGLQLLSHAKQLALEACNEIPDVNEDSLSNEPRFTDNKIVDEIGITECIACGGHINPKTGRCGCNL
ncbi:MULTISPECIES: hypothetical protein [unclassified Agarivorans]|uniref:hypothetical protein n=1 Tax=unclassified Agarivorans TaxID=2636026 RepID=UPI0026E349A1|nr:MULTISPECIES: hypothetical protein [unclassified Agarivorans]MDO6685275.1 hypothetical protein [Agarivorans sp. 3_MG-2023]MDO6715553.1 hypothetical protein [Agarivorans sp. 2_MG-2023]